MNTNKLLLTFTTQDLTSIAQIVFTMIGGGYALVLFSISNKEKRQNFILNILEKLYSDNDIVQVLYAVDKGSGLEALKEKVSVMRANPNYEYKGKVDLEKETDKTLRYLDCIGALLVSGQLKKKDLTPFRYELRKMTIDPTLNAYIEYLVGIDVNFDNLKCLKKVFKNME